MAGIDPRAPTNKSLLLLFFRKEELYLTYFETLEWPERAG
jgi:hypothetical protein